MIQNILFIVQLLEIVVYSLQSLLVSVVKHHLQLLSGAFVFCDVYFLERIADVVEKGFYLQSDDLLQFLGWT